MLINKPQRSICYYYWQKMDSLYIFSGSRAEYEKLTQSFLSEKQGWMSESFMAGFFSFNVVLEPSKSEDYISTICKLFPTSCCTVLA